MPRTELINRRRPGFKENELKTKN